MNLFNVDIRGTNNYKGIVTLGTDVTAGLTTTLKALGDGVGGYSPLKLSTTQVEAGKVVFTDGILSRDVNDATGLRLFGGTLTTTNDSGYIYMQRDTTNFGAPIFGLANGNFDSNFFRWERNGTEITRLTATGNWYMGSGGVTPSARLHVRGDGTNPIINYDNGAGSVVGRVLNNGNYVLFGSDANNSIASISSGLGINFNSNWVANSDNQINFYTLSRTNTSGTFASFGFQAGSIAMAAGSANPRILYIPYTINNSGAQSGTATGIFLNATETALNSMTHNLMDLQVGGVSKFKVRNDGQVNAGYIYSTADIYATSGGYLGWSGAAYIRGTSNIITFVDSSYLSAPLLTLGGTTNAFPALKRSGTTLEVRLADDSAYAPLYAGDDSRFRGLFRFQDTSGNNKGLFYSDGLSGVVTFYINGSVGLGVLGNDASAKLQIDSTTQGFLLPRVTTTQKNAIATPATGLVVFDTTLAKLAVYTGAAWETVTSV